MISLIAAASENNVIGNKGKIPWYLPNDFKHFKEITLGHPIVMGRKTYESIGKLLPGRENIILTRQDIAPEGYTVVHSADKILERSKQEDIFVIGGSEIYNIFLPSAGKVYLTRVQTDTEGDTFFPKIDEAVWNLVSEEKHPRDEKNKFNHTFLTYERRQ